MLIDRENKFKTKKKQTQQKHMIEGVPQGWAHGQLPKDVSHPIS